MKCTLVGIRGLDYISKKDGKRVIGTELHMVGAMEDSAEMKGQRVESVFTSLNVSGLSLGVLYDFVYDRKPGSKFTDLVEIIPVEQPTPQQPQLEQASKAKAG